MKLLLLLAAALAVARPPPTPPKFPPLHHPFKPPKAQCGPGAFKFDIINFWAGCTPHSLYCAYEFLLAPTPGSSMTTCNAFLVGPDELPTTGMTACADTDFAFRFVRNGDQTITMTVTTDLLPRVNLTGTHTIKADEIERVNHGSVIDDLYIGAANFTIVPSVVIV